jgi:hypothetical protein
MLFDDVALLMVQMTVVKVVNVIAMPDCGVAAAGWRLILSRSRRTASARPK